MDFDEMLRADNFSGISQQDTDFDEILWGLYDCKVGW